MIKSVLLRAYLGVAITVVAPLAALTAIVLSWFSLVTISHDDVKKFEKLLYSLFNK